MNPLDPAASSSRTYVHQNKLDPFASTFLDSFLFVLSVFLSHIGLQSRLFLFRMIA